MEQEKEKQARGGALADIVKGTHSGFRQAWGYFAWAGDLGCLSSSSLSFKIGGNTSTSRLGSWATSDSHDLKIRCLRKHSTPEELQVVIQEKL